MSDIVERLNEWAEFDEESGSGEEGVCVLLREAADEIKRLRTLAEDVVRLVSALEYIAGIAERGLGRPQWADESVEQFILSYVKELERES